MQAPWGWQAASLAVERREEGGAPAGLSALTLPPQSPQAGPSLCPEFPKTLAFCPSVLGGVMGWAGLTPEISINHISIHSCLSITHAEAQRCREQAGQGDQQHPNTICDGSLQLWDS